MPHPVPFCSAWLSLLLNEATIHHDHASPLSLGV
jgi:hypothetical protein